MQLSSARVTDWAQHKHKVVNNNFSYLVRLKLLTILIVLCINIKKLWKRIIWLKCSRHWWFLWILEISVTNKVIIIIIIIRAYFAPIKQTGGHFMLRQTIQELKWRCKQVSFEKFLEMFSAWLRVFQWQNVPGSRCLIDANEWLLCYASLKLSYISCCFRALYNTYITLQSFHRVRPLRNIVDIYKHQLGIYLTYIGIYR